MSFDERTNKFICDKLDCDKTATTGHPLCYEHVQKEKLRPAKTEEA